MYGEICIARLRCPHHYCGEILNEIRISEQVSIKFYFSKENNKILTKTVKFDKDYIPPPVTDSKAYVIP